MVLKDLHVHTNYCDGKDKPEDIVLAAIDMGMKTLGFSGHGYTYFDESYCMSKEGTEEYKKEIASLKEKYSDQIEILCGVERDMYTTEDTSSFDYVIGSLHYILVDGEYIPVDWKYEIIKDAADKYFGGDMTALAVYYLDAVSEVAERTKCTIVGHFDLITKFNENEQTIDVTNPRYISAYKKAIDRIMESCKLFEINTGAISRGYRSSPYPSPEIIEYIKNKGGEFILSSDAHTKEGLCYAFDKYESLLL